MTHRWDNRDRKRDKKNTLRQMNSFSEYTDHESEEAKELSRKRKLLKKQEEELLDAFDTQAN